MIDGYSLAAWAARRLLIYVATAFIAGGLFFLGAGMFVLWAAL